jgi:hypothetical protein
VSLLELQILHCSPTTLFFGYHVNDASSLANLIPDIVLSVANKIDDARDFIMFKAVCKDWNCARSGEACQFDPWILKSEFIGESGVGHSHLSLICDFLRSPFIGWEKHQIDWLRRIWKPSCLRLQRLVKRTHAESFVSSEAHLPSSTLEMEPNGDSPSLYLVP